MTKVPVAPPEVLKGWAGFTGPLGDDPYGLYADVREEAPVRQVLLADGRPAWIVTGYAEGRQALLDARLVKRIDTALAVRPLRSMGRYVGRWSLAVLLVLTGALGALSHRAWPLTIDPVPVTPLASSGGLWRMTFADEFDGPGVDASKWSNGFGWGDTADNFAAWCDPTANAVVDGALVQRADRLPAPQHGKNYSGACLHTKGTFSQLYGYWEARLRVAAGPGVHSAFWGKPASEAWPPELDVEEIGGDRPDTVIMSAHWRDETGHRLKNQRYRGPDFSGGFHVFGLEWSPGGSTWYVDGVERTRIPDGAEEMAAQGPFYALLNLQVGLAGAVQASATTPFPAYQLVDYVRIWERPFRIF